MRPILFNSEMVRAILDGNKTQTRRVVTGEALDLLADGMFHPEYVALPDNKLSCYGYAGDRLWVREAWAAGRHVNHLKPTQIFNDAQIWYKADGGRRYDVGEKWEMGKIRPSIFMPRWASRITLEVTGVKVERLQDISSEDAMAEGVSEVEAAWVGMGDALGLGPQKFRLAFRRLWDSISAERGYSWDSNPWVWVVEFQRA